MRSEACVTSDFAKVGKGQSGASGMDDAARRTVLDLLDKHSLMTVATLRPDGWPQATTVGYANDGLTMYFLCAATSQKAENLARDNRISLTIDADTSDPMAITGLSMAARATPVTDQAEIGRIDSSSSLGNTRNTRRCRRRT